MSHRVVVQSTLELPPHAGLGLILDDESALALTHGEGFLIEGIAPAGPHAIFNRRQFVRLVAEIRAVSKHQPRVIQGNLNEIADLVESHESNRDDRYVIFFSE